MFFSHLSCLYVHGCVLLQEGEGEREGGEIDRERETETVVYLPCKASVFSPSFRKTQ